MNKKEYQAPNATVISIAAEGMLAASSNIDKIPMDPNPNIPGANERQFAWDGNYWE